MYACMHVGNYQDHYDRTTTEVVGSPEFTPAPTSCYRGKGWAEQARTVSLLA